MDDWTQTGIKEVRQDGPVTVAVLAGEVDLNLQPTVQAALESACRRRPQRLIVDLSEVSYMDSSGVGTLVLAYRQVQGYGGRFLLVGVQDKVKAVLEITQLDKFFTILKTVDEALQA